MTNVNGTLFFGATDAPHGRELWKSDGTEAGTALVKDITSGPDSSNPSELTNVNGTLFFVANSDQLWKSDGTEAGTKLVKFLPQTESGPAFSPHALTNVNGTLFFAASDETHGKELWKSDGTTAGTVLVKDISPGASDSNPAALTNVNGTLFFSVNDSSLWKSDGTTDGTVLVKTINPGGYSFPQELTNVNGTLFFSATDGAHGGELWKSNGTADGTVQVKDIRPGSADSNPRELTNVNGTLFFRADDGAHGRELWKSSGSEAGTVLVKDINPGSAPSDPNANAHNLTNVNGTLFFTANDGTHGGELWKSDGTDAGTVLVKDIIPGPGGSNPGELTNVNGTLFFDASDPAHGDELWQSDGTEAGTALVQDIRPGTGGSAPRTLTDVNGRLFFDANDGTHGDELWKAEGPPPPGPTGPTGPSGPTGVTSASPLPTVESVAPTVGPEVGGDTVEISGTTLAGTTQVTFGGTPASVLVPPESGRVTVEAPPGQGVVDVRVTTAAGTSATVPRDRYSYYSYPTLASVEPGRVLATGGATVRLTGSNFKPSTRVLVDGTAVPSQFDSTTSLTIVAPPGTPGRHQVTATSSLGAADPVVGALSVEYVSPPCVNRRCATQNLAFAARDLYAYPYQDSLQFQGPAASPVTAHNFSTAGKDPGEDVAAYADPFTLSAQDRVSFKDKPRAAGSGEAESQSQWSIDPPPTPGNPVQIALVVRPTVAAQASVGDPHALSNAISAFSGWQVDVAPVESVSDNPILAEANGDVSDAYSRSSECPFIIGLSEEQNAAAFPPDKFPCIHDHISHDDAFASVTAAYGTPAEATSLERLPTARSPVTLRFAVPYPVKTLNIGLQADATADGSCFDPPCAAQASTILDPVLVPLTPGHRARSNVSRTSPSLPVLTSASPRGPRRGGRLWLQGRSLGTSKGKVLLISEGGSAIVAPVKRWSTGAVVARVPRSISPGRYQVAVRPSGAPTSSNVLPLHIGHGRSAAVTSVDPPSAPAGGRVTIRGRGLKQVDEVRFGGVKATFRHAGGALVASAPSGRGAVHVTVRSRAGVSRTSADDLFSYLDTVSQTVGPRGAKLVLSDGSAELLIPPGALDAPGAVTVTGLAPQASRGFIPAGTAARVRIGAGRLRRPALLSLQTQPASLLSSALPGIYAAGSGAPLVPAAGPARHATGSLTQSGDFYTLKVRRR